MFSKFIILLILGAAQISWAQESTTEDFYDANENYGYGSTYTSIYTPTYRSHPIAASNEIEAVGSLDSHPLSEIDAATANLEVPASDLEIANNELAVRMVAQEGRVAPKLKMPAAPIGVELRKSRK